MKKQEKTEISKERIINAAIKEFGLNGYRNGTLNNICATGIAKGLLYHNFKNKEQLYLEVVKKAFNSFIDYINSKSLSLNFGDYIQARILFLKDNILLGRILFEVLMQPPVELKQEIKEIKKDFDQINDKIYFDLLKGVSLRKDVSKQEAEKYFHMMQEMYNDYFGNMLFSETSIDDVVKKHEEILPKFIDYMINGIVDKNI